MEGHAKGDFQGFQETPTEIFIVNNQCVAADLIANTKSVQITSIFISFYNGECVHPFPSPNNSHWLC